MSELRLNILNGNWTVIAPERGRKPKRFNAERSADIRSLVPHDENCPFCPGNEPRFQIDLLDEMPAPNGGWQARLVENRYKIFDDLEGCSVAPEPFEQRGMHYSYKGCGNHYLVLEHPLHNRVMGLMEPTEVSAVFELYAEADRLLSGNPNHLVSLVFKNQGPSAGGSQPHAHSQIVGSRVVPAWIRHALNEEQRYFDQRGVCPTCAMLDSELQEGARIIAETGQAVLLSPYAAAVPYEAWVVPKRHFACYRETTAEEQRSLADGVRRVLRAYVEKLDNPDFNYFFHSAPNPLSGVPFHHFFIRIVPRIGTPGGFEVGTGMSVNPVAPEEARDLLAGNEG